MQTLLLDRSLWDLVGDAAGDIAVASDPYSQAQDAASEIKTVSGECWYDTVRGLPYWERLLGRMPPLSLVRARLVAAALLVPGVVSAAPFFSSLRDRLLRGQVQITNDDGQASSAGF